MANKKCVHRYRLRDLNRKSNVPYMVYVCTKQSCTHHIKVELVDGKLAECNRCGNPFVMKLVKLKHGERLTVRPHCDNCTKTPARLKDKKEKVSNAIDQLMESILPKGM